MRFDRLPGRESSDDRRSDFVIMFAVLGVVCLFVLAGAITVYDGVRGRL
jgi:hypothetical protein